MNTKSSYEQEEVHLSEQTKAFVDFLTQKGLLVNPNAYNSLAQKKGQDFFKKSFHNTKLLLKNYRDIVWAMETIPSDMKNELDIPLEELDQLLEKIDIGLSLENKKMESRLRAIYKSRVMLSRLNEAIAILKDRPTDGALIYEVIYKTYIGPKPLSILDLIQDLGISNRRYYLLRNKGIDLISIKLWSSNNADLDMWMELLTIIDG